MCERCRRKYEKYTEEEKTQLHDNARRHLGHLLTIAVMNPEIQERVLDLTVIVGPEKAWALFDEALDELHKVMVETHKLIPTMRAQLGVLTKGFSGIVNNIIEETKRGRDQGQDPAPEIPEEVAEKVASEMDGLLKKARARAKKGDNDGKG